LDDCTGDDIYGICQGKSIPENLRPDVWTVCLDTRNKLDQLSQFNEIYDLPFQKQLRQDCHNFVDKLGNDDEDKLSVVSDLESILTFYCKNRNLVYETSNGWIELLLPLISLKLVRSDTYNMFEVIRDTYIPKGCAKKGAVFHVFRLLILYHDPELCTLLDTKRITPDMYAIAWFNSLFASTCTLPVVLAMWDNYFQQSDPFLVFFLSLIILINGREQIMLMRDEPKEKVIESLANMPCNIEADDVADFCSLAQYYSMKTPASFKRDLLQVLFGVQTNKEEANTVSQVLCLPISVNELIENSTIENQNPEAMRFFVVDCRPAEQYNAGHLSTAFHLDCNLMLQEPVAFQTAIQGLLRAQKHAIEVNSNAGGEHLCFLGSGRMEEDQYTNMVVASFLQKNTKYVSLLTGGFNAVHEYFGQEMIDCLDDHNPERCIVCEKFTLNNNNNGNSRSNSVKKDHTVTNNNAPNTASAMKKGSSNDLLSKLSSVMKTKSAEVKGKLFDYIANPNGQGQGATATTVQEKHVSSSERNGKRYRNVAPVFSIDDENDMHSEESHEMSDKEEIVSIQSYVRQPEVIKHFRCQEVQVNGSMYESFLLVTATHIVVLREVGKKDQGKVIVSIERFELIKLDCNHKCPFRYDALFRAS
jgi:hypothetical protein